MTDTILVKYLANDIQKILRLIKSSAIFRIKKLGKHAIFVIEQRNFG
jgi:hypothetical protein